jgi:hypothetical protein
MPDCQFCTGSHYLSDMADLGPCVCCTPEALTAAESFMGEEGFNAKMVEETRERIDDVIDAMTIYLVSIGLAADPVTIGQPELHDLADKLSRLDDACYLSDDNSPALRQYQEAARLREWCAWLLEMVRPYAKSEKMIPHLEQLLKDTDPKA